ncbi:hypothetical protein ABG768_027143, partial [Culter alburnus]
MANSPRGRPAGPVRPYRERQQEQTRPEMIKRPCVCYQRAAVKRLAFQACG